MGNPMSTIESFNRQFDLNQPQKEAVEWAWPSEMGDTMFAVVNCNTYTRASQNEGSVYRKFVSASAGWREYIRDVELNKIRQGYGCRADRLTC